MKSREFDHSADKLECIKHNNKKTLKKQHPRQGQYKHVHLNDKKIGS